MVDEIRDQGDRAVSNADDVSDRDAAGRLIGPTMSASGIHGNACSAR
ncbi:hypothetical protein [Pseudonocardia oroxyli]|nr:hypothetical protein [Pseudonocardia oroxyli]